MNTLLILSSLLEVKVVQWPISEICNYLYLKSNDLWDTILPRFFTVSDSHGTLEKSGRLIYIPVLLSLYHPYSLPRPIFTERCGDGLSNRDGPHARTRSRAALERIAQPLSVLVVQRSPSRARPQNRRATNRCAGGAIALRTRARRSLASFRARARIAGTRRRFVEEPIARRFLSSGDDRSCICVAQAIGANARARARATRVQPSVA